MGPVFQALSEEGIDTALRLRGELFRHEELSYEPGDAARLLRELVDDPAAGMLWLIVVDGQAAGYLLLTFCYSLEFGGRFGLLDEFYVEDRWRGQGIGTAALEFVEGECRNRGLRALRLEVMHANSGALELYRRRGYAVEPRHLMTKWI